MLKTYDRSDFVSLQEPELWKEVNYRKIYLLSFVGLNIGAFSLLAWIFYEASQWTYIYLSLGIIALNILGALGLVKLRSLEGAFHFVMCINFLGFGICTLSSGGLYSPFIYWTFISPIVALMLYRVRGIYLWFFGIILGLLALYYLELQEMRIQILTPLNTDKIVHLSETLTLSFIAYLGILLIIKDRYNQFSETVIQKFQEDNNQLRKQVQVIDSRNYRLIQLYQNLQKVEKVNNQKNEILTEAARIMDFKNKRIRGMFEDFKEQRESLVESNMNITNSIRYAQRIQEAITPDREWVISHFRDAFIFYQPKDIVSGDFYWFTTMQTEEGNLKILIAADCTGHGVPGAFMTVMGNSIVNEVVNEMKITDPGEILYKLDQKILEILSDKDGKVAIHDGMDMAILAINDDNKTVKYAAAHNPLYYVRQQKLKVIKGSKFAVGSSQYRTKKVFEVHTIDSLPGDVFYIFTDGFQDQFGKKEKRKYMTRRFRNFLFSINRLPLCRQGEKVANEFETWKQDLPQTDDTLVIGFRM